MQSENFYDRILVPTDGSLPSLVALELAAFIAKKLKSRVTVLHTVSHEFMRPHVRGLLTQYRVSDRMVPYVEHVPIGGEVSSPEVVGREITNWYHQKGEKAIAEAVALLKEENVPVDKKLVEHADPAETILKEAEKGNHGLIIMGSSGEEEQEPHLGSVAKKVSRHAQTPVLIAKEKRLLSKMLVPIDGSENSEKALQHAALLAKKTDAKMTILYVQESGLFNLRPKVTKEIGAIILSKAAEQSKGIKIDQKLESGDPAKIITRIAEKDGYDLIVMGSRGLGTIGRFLLGSVSDHVIHHTNRSVLIVHSQPEKGRKEEIGVEKMARHAGAHFQKDDKRFGVKL